MNPQLLSFNNLSQFNTEITHFSSTRLGGISRNEYASCNLGNYSDDCRENVFENRQRLCNTLNIPSSNLITVHQVHGSNVKYIDASIHDLPAGEREQLLNGYDALICNTADICIAVTTADCVPILLYDPVSKSIAAIHSGWRSTLQNIVTITIKKMEATFATQASNLVAAIGPCISRSAYEVGEDVQEAFVKAGYATKYYFYPKTDSKYWFDIRSVVNYQLRNCGITNIEDSNHCTFTEADLFFSARRQGVHSGRMLSGIMLKQSTS